MSAPAYSKTIQICVITLTKRIIVPSYSNTTIGTLKRMIQDKEGIDPDQQILVYDKKNLDPHFTLSDYNIEDGAKLILIL